MGRQFYGPIRFDLQLVWMCIVGPADKPQMSPVGLSEMQAVNWVGGTGIRAHSIGFSQPCRMPAVIGLTATLSLRLYLSSGFPSPSPSPENPKAGKS